MITCMTILQVQSTKDLLKYINICNKHKPAWNDICNDAYSQKDKSFSCGRIRGKPKHGWIFVIYNKSRANFKYY